MSTTVVRFALLAAVAAGAQLFADEGAKAGYNPEISKLVWSDEFDGKGLLDSSKWDYEEGYIRNKEAQFYTRADARNARVENGVLVIEALKDADGKITSASVNTLGKFDFLYGRVEVRARVPKGRGTWPAIWMMGTDIRSVSWPKCGEIDIMEQVGFNPESFQANVHTYGSIVLDKNSKNPIKKGWKRLFENYTDFHTYALEWYPDKLKFFYDGKFIGEYKKLDDRPEYWHFNKPMYLLINLAIGGSWGGQKGIDENIFPARYEIDWVRYYK